MVTISTDNTLITTIITFQIDAENSDALLKVVISETEEIKSKFEGFVSVSFHLSKDKTCFTEYAQWESLEQLQEMQKDLSIIKKMEIAKQLSKSVEVILYDVVWQKTA